MEPEIARRCKTCGAAVRAGSSFCPQCGASLTKSDGAGMTAAASPAPVAVTEQSEQQPAEVAQAAEKIAPATEKTIAPPLQPDAGLKATAPNMNAEAIMNADTILPGSIEVPGKEAAAADAPVETPGREQGVAQSKPADGTTDRRQRLTVGGRDAAAFDGASNRAEKLRRASNVVLDEAAADPSLRFVLVAAALIILSLLLLLLGRFL